jgi:hypothetical protein
MDIQNIVVTAVITFLVEIILRKSEVSIRKFFSRRKKSKQ